MTDSSYKDSPLYAVNTQKVGAAGAAVGTSITVAMFANLIGNNDFQVALLHHDWVAIMEVGMAFLVLIISLIAAWVGRAPQIPDDHSPKP